MESGLEDRNNVRESLFDRFAFNLSQWSPA